MLGIDFSHFGRFVCPYNLTARGDKLFYCIKKADFDANDYKSDLYMLHDGIQKQLTNSGDVSSYYLLDDGILFSSVRSAKDKAEIAKGRPLTVLYALDYDGGEAREVARIDVTISAMYFLDRAHFFFIGEYSHEVAKAFVEQSGDAEKAMEALRAEEAYKVLDEIPFWDDENGYINKTRKRLYYFENGTIHNITDEWTSVEKLALSPDQTTLVYAATSYDALTPVFEKLYRLDVRTRTVTDISLTDRALYHVLSFVSDAELIVGCSDCMSYGINQNPDLYCCNLNTRSAVCLYQEGGHNMHNAVATDIQASRTLPDAPLVYERNYYFVSTVEDSAHLMCLDMKSGDIAPVTWQRGSVLEVVSFQDGFAAIAMRDLNGCEIYRIDRTGNEKLLSALNLTVNSNYAKHKMQDISFKNESGTALQGYVIVPANGMAQKKCPAVLCIHGGPKLTYGTVYFHEMQMWADRGYAVLFCNPTGSDGKGNAFADIRGKYGTVDYTDLLAFCDACLAQCSFIDPERIGVVGGSYGGFMVNWIIGHTDRFRAAVSQRSISNWVSFAMQSDIGFYFASDQCGDTIWSNEERVWQQSPLRYANCATTPTLFIQGDRDYRCPMAEGLQMFTALKVHGVPARLCLFKGENHELSRSGKPKHRIRRLEEITAWLDKYLKG